MKCLSTLISMLLLTSCSQGSKPPPPSTPPRAIRKEISPEQMQEAMTKASTIGANHHALDPLIGSYKVEAKLWMKPGAEPVKEVGSAEFKWILGGHYVSMDYHSSFQGQPYEGRGVYGFSNTQNSYENTYIDSMGTDIMKSRGQASRNGAVITFHGEFLCPITNGPMQTCDVLTLGINRHTFEMYHPALDGSGEYKAMELVFSKVSPASGTRVVKSTYKHKHK